MQSMGVAWQMRKEAGADAKRKRCTENDNVVKTTKPRERQSALFFALRLLCNLGWSPLSSAQCQRLRGTTRELIFRGRVVNFLRSQRFDYKGEPFPLSSSGIDQILRVLTTLSLRSGLLAANERFYRIVSNGITVTEFMPDGHKHQATIPIIDWRDPAANQWEVAESVPVLASQGIHHQIPDILCYVNGIPLVVIEAKQPETDREGKAMLTESIRQHQHNQQADEIPGLFAYAQLLLAISHDDGCYGTIQTTAKFWGRWREEIFNDELLISIIRRPVAIETLAEMQSGWTPRKRAAFERSCQRLRKITVRDQLLVGLLTPARLLAYLHGFVLFDQKQGKIVARSPQFFAVLALTSFLRERKCALLRGDRPDQHGGVIWHTAGSGKSFTMVFLSKALLLDPGLLECRLIVVTDRIDLEAQLAKNFISTGAFGSAHATSRIGEKCKATSGYDLARRIGGGSERIIFTLVLKFNTASKLPECYNVSPDVIVLVDEGHRSHGGETHLRMRKALPFAAYIAFTGTPLLREEKVSNTFGPIIHAYPLQRAVEDGIVAPLIYEERIPRLSLDDASVNVWFNKITAGSGERRRAELKERFFGKSALYGARSRIELIALDIALHFHETIKKPGLGLKAQLATASKRDAIRYKTALDAIGLVSSAVIISAPATREGLEDHDDGARSEVHNWWKNSIGHSSAAWEKATLAAFSEDGDPDLLIVVDRLLTGFDEARNSVLYIDKPLRGHTLIQAVARVNRLHEAKSYGFLVDYRGILRELDTAIRAYRQLEEQTLGGFDACDLVGLYRQFSTEYRGLPELHTSVWNFFKEVKNPEDLEQYRHLLMPKFVPDPHGKSGETYDANQKCREDFYEALSRFGRCLQAALSSRSFFEDSRFSESVVRTFKQDLLMFTGLRRIVRRDALENVDERSYDEQIRRMVDAQVVGHGVREPEGVYLVHQLGQHDDPDTWSEGKTRNEADLIQTRLRRTIEHDLAVDPYAQRFLSERLKAAIAEAESMFEYPRKQYAVLRTFEDTVARQEIKGIPPVFGDNAAARAYYGVFRMIFGEALSADANDPVTRSCIDDAFSIDAAVLDAVAENSLNPQNIDAAIRQALLPRLFHRIGLNKARIVIDQVIHITRIRQSRERR